MAYSLAMAAGRGWWTCCDGLSARWPTLPALNCYIRSPATRCQLAPQMSKALYPVTNPLSHLSLDAGWIYTSNLQVKGSAFSSQSLDLSLSSGSCAKMTLSL